MIDEKIEAVMSQADGDSAMVDRFVSLAVKGLVPMFNQQRQLFCYKLKKTDQGMLQEGLSHRYTMMTLMGLHRLQQSGAVSPFNSQSIVEALLSDVSWIDNIGDLGVLLWMCGIVCPEQLPKIEARLDVESALRRFRGAKQGVTMELAWFLTGLSYWGQAYPEKIPHLEKVAFETYRLLTRNRGERGFYGHLCTSGSFAGVVRGSIGTYADQVYPIYALAQFSRAYGHGEAASHALKSALALCEEQGPLGQWWWHYDSGHGRVADGYPVYSVHQHAMGPMTLFGLGDVINQNFDEWIYRGLRWVNANNELHYDMEDAQNGVIWRSILRTRRSMTRYLKARLGRHSDSVQCDRSQELDILYECRPYEFGWLLYAFAKRAGTPSRILVGEKNSIL